MPHALFTICSSNCCLLGNLWGLYAHWFQQYGDKENGRIMAFLGSGLLFSTAVIAPLIILKLKGGNIAFWSYPAKGWQWSLIAGTLGAIGALGVLLAFGKMPSPAFVPVIMSIIFAGAPMVNAIVSTTKEETGPLYAGLLFWVSHLPHWVDT